MSNQSTVDISGLDKAAVLAVLFNGSAPGGMGFLQAGFGPSIMTVEDAQQLIDGGGRSEGSPNTHSLYYDYLFGRPLKVNLTGDEFDPWGYDRDNGGPGTAQRFIDELRRTSQVDSHELSDHRTQLLNQRVEQTEEFVKTPMQADGNTIHLGGQDVAGVVTHALDEQSTRLRRDWKS